MPILSPRTAFPTGWRTNPPGWLPRDPLDRRITLARAILTIERTLPRLWPAALFFGFYIALALTGVFAFIPWPVQALGLAATITASGLALADGFADFHWPRSLDGARRLERDNHLVHRPISERGDVLAAGGDAFAQALWQLHQARSLPARFRLALPAVSIAERDPRGLRWYLLIALAVGLAFARGDTGARLVSAFDSGAGASATLDAWVDPPPYTGVPLFSLRAGDSSTITVPQGSVIHLRVHGAPRTPGLAAGTNNAPRFAGDEGEYASNVLATSSMRLRVQVGGKAIGKWSINALPDALPRIEMTSAPRRTEQLATQFRFKGSDDYGIASLRAVITPQGQSDKTRSKPLVTELPLNQPNARAVDQAAFVDLTSHPYAGMMVDAKLEVRDAIGQVGVSRTVSFRLPARVFTDPLARALVEQRQKLGLSEGTATQGAGRDRIMLTLDALSIDPERFYDGKPDIYLALRNAFYGVKNAKGEKDIARVQALLWETALKLERGGLLSAAEELRKLQAMLTAALASGAPQEVIDELLKRYNQAMQRYMEAMAANPPPAGQEPLSPDTKTVNENDIQTLMQMVQKLTEAGEREKAAQLLAMVQSMLENMRVSQGGGGGKGMGQQSPQDKKLNEQIQKFGGLMNKQRDLLDKTFRQQQGQGNPQEGGAQGLSKQQSDLQRELQETMKGLDPKAQQKLREAGDAMAQAQGALGRNDLPNAGNAQNQALAAMRQGAEELARQGRGGQVSRADPLGRSGAPLGNSGVKIPGPTDLARAREILQELRRRAAEMGRPQAERDYLDRLLKAF